MKIKPKHIQKFEAFIQNSKITNNKGATQSKDDKKQTPVDQGKNSPDDADDENDLVAEMKRFFAEQEKNNPYLWTSTI